MQRLDGPKAIGPCYTQAMGSPSIFESGLQGIRLVRWEELPLGSVILEWPSLHNASIPELLGYPLITEALRSELFRRCQFLKGRTVKIVDPSLGLDEGGARRFYREAGRLKDSLAAVNELKAGILSRALNLPEAREGLSQQSLRDSSPYILVKDWMRSLSGSLREGGVFCPRIWSPGIEKASLGELIGGLVSGAFPFLPGKDSSQVDVGIDLSYSMTHSGKSGFAFSAFAEIIPALALRLGTSRWRLWGLGEDARPLSLERFLGGPEGLSGLVPERGDSQTRFAPFFRKAYGPDVAEGSRLCIIITDGLCQDKAESLRILEKLKQEGIEYLQLILLCDEEHRMAVQSSGPDRSRDGFLTEGELGAGDVEIRRSDEELGAYCTERLREATDLAEAAHGGQLVLSWYPLLSFLTVDVYERYLGTLLPAVLPILAPAFKA